jgi:hypothetical protein
MNKTRYFTVLTTIVAGLLVVIVLWSICADAFKRTADSSSRDFNSGQMGIFNGEQGTQHGPVNALSSTQVSPKNTGGSQSPSAQHELGTVLCYNSCFSTLAREHTHPARANEAAQHGAGK